MRWKKYLEMNSGEIFYEVLLEDERASRKKRQDLNPILACPIFFLVL